MSNMQPQYNERVRVDEEHGAVSITDFSVSDRQVAEYFALYNPDQREDRLEAAIRAGVLALKSVDVGERVDYVKKEFEQLRSDVEKKMDDTVRDVAEYLGEDGKMSRMMERYVGEEGEVFKAMDEYIGEDGEVNEMGREMAEEWAAMMDPRNEKSPLNLLRKEILGRLDEVRDGFAKRMGEKSVEDVTPIKGRKFEEYCLDEVSKLVRVTGDKIKDTSKTTGSKPGGKKGDFVVEIAGTDTSITIEVKDQGGISENKVMSLLDNSMANRGADFGLFIIKNVEAFPKSMGWFHDFGSTNKLAVALGSKADGNARDWTIHKELLLVAYKWARAKAIANKLDAESVDAKAIMAKMNEVRASLSGLSTIKKHATSIANTANKIRGEADTVTRTANDALDDVSGSLEKAGVEGR